MNVQSSPDPDVHLPVTIRPMRLDDLAAVQVVDRASFPTPWSEQTFRGELTTNRYADYIVAEVEGRVVGYAGMWVILDEAHVTNIAVHPDFRRRGIGARLLATLCARAKRRHCERITLEVRVSNLTAQRLYRRFGFTEQGIRYGYYSDTQEDALIMTKFGLDQAGATEQG